MKKVYVDNLLVGEYEAEVSGDEIFITTKTEPEELYMEVRLRDEAKSIFVSQRTEYILGTEYKINKEDIESFTMFDMKLDDVLSRMEVIMGGRK